MYKKILAPLDGSEFAECILPHVEAIGSGCHVPEIVLFRVVEPLSAESVAALATAGDNYLRDALLESQEEAKTYLEKKKDELAKNGLTVQTMAVDGDAANEILEYAGSNGVDLILISTHGKSGISRWFFGSVAQKVLHHAMVPVLMTSPPGCRVSP